MPELKVGNKAPDFIAQTTDGKLGLNDYRGKNLVLYFYVRDHTLGCTMQSCSLRDRINEIKAQNAEVLGVSVDDLESHRRFKEKEKLNFPLVADVDFSISKLFGAFNEKRQISRRMTFVIDKDGIIRYILSRVDVRGHAKEVVEVLQKMK
ncbi:MAG: peroxiredoxin [Nitrososphaerales archaeon]